MLSEAVDAPAISARDLGKSYQIHSSPRARLWQMIRPNPAQVQVFHALRGVDLDIARGESVGVIGQNGAGKSTLLQLICGTLTPSSGTIDISGRIAPLLELGAGFSMDFTGRENIFLNASVLGLGREETLDRMQAIIDFADIGDFIDEPVRIYSSGMYVRLAFAIAASIEPDILVIDEAIAVGDGQFARKSFDRIMQLRERGVTILFCSHSLFQVEALCTKALWLHKGEVRASGAASAVVAEYDSWVNAQIHAAAATPAAAALGIGVRGHAAFSAIKVSCDGVEGIDLKVRSGHSQLVIRLEYHSDPTLPMPNLAVAIYPADGRILTSTGNWMDGVALTRSANGDGVATLTYPNLPLLKGKYTISVYLMCERGVHVYEGIEHMATLNVEQEHLEQGLVSLPHRWENLP